MNTYIEKAKENAKVGVKNKEGGPFGAVVVDKGGNIVGNGNNKVLNQKDPTAHAEIVAIRDACKTLNTSDLSGCEIYATCEPCPMCLSAIVWSNIKKIHYACTREDAKSIGFRDNDIYEFIKGNNKKLLKLEQLNREECMDIIKLYKENDGIIY